MHIQHNNGKHSHNHRCCWKAIIVTYSECVRSIWYQACNAQALYYIVICGLSKSTAFFQIITQQHNFLNKLLNRKCTLLLSLQLVSRTHLILRRIQQDVIYHTTAQFLNKLLNRKCTLLLSLQLVSRTHLILRIIQQDVINVHRSSCQVLVILVRF
jgi:hypothetical protein